MLTLSKIQEKITLMKKQEVLYQKWDIRHRNKDFTDLYWLYSPNTEKYFFEANPSFFYEYEHLDDMGRFPVVMVRDGYLGIIDFFISNPKPPEDFLTNLLIHKKYASLVPQAWEKQVALYITQSRGNTNKENKKLIVHGFGVIENFLKKTPEQLVEHIKKISNKYSETIFLCPSKYSALKPNDSRVKGYDFLLLAQLFKTFGFDVKIEDDVSKYIHLLNDSNYDFLNLDLDRFFIADNFVDYFLSASGCHSLNEELEVGEQSLDYNLSMYHKISIEEFKFAKEKSLHSRIFVDYKMSGMPKHCSIFQVLHSEDLVRHFVDNF